MNYSREYAAKTESQVQPDRPGSTLRVSTAGRTPLAHGYPLPDLRCARTVTLNGFFWR